MKYEDHNEPAKLRLLVTVTFKPNQLRAHLLPIIRLEEVRDVTLVTDTVTPMLPKVRCAVPPRWLVRVLGRAGSKFVVCLILALRERPDWIIAYHILPHGITAAVVGRLTGRKVLYHQIGGPGEWEGGGWMSGNVILGRLSRPVRPLEALLLSVIRRCTAVVTMGEAGRSVLLARNVAPKRVHAIPPSVDLARFRPSPGEQRRDYDLVTVGDLIERKRTADLLDAVARLRKSRPLIRAAVIGVGPLEAALRLRAQALGVSDAVDFLGYRDDVEEVFHRSAVFVLPSRSEGLSIALCEAMACGLPSVVSDVGELRDLVRNGQNGFLVEPGDSEKLADCIERLLDDPELLSAAGARAAADARAFASIERISGLYRGVLAVDAP